MLDSLVHRQPLRCWILSCNNDVDIIATAQTVIRNRQESIGIGRQIDSDDFGFFVDDMVDEAGVLVA